MSWYLTSYEEFNWAPPICNAPQESVSSLASCQATKVVSDGFWFALIKCPVYTLYYIDCIASLKYYMAEDNLMN